jgi:hypothetical protein
MPTRFAKQLAQLMRGAISLGTTRQDALALAIRCGRDSIPPLRLEMDEDDDRPKIYYRLAANISLDALSPASNSIQ